MARSKEVISIEELHERRKIVRKDEGRGCRDDEESSGIVVQVEAESSSSLVKRFQSVVEAKEDDAIQTPNTRIHKVPSMLRQQNKDYNKYFEPRVVSIGPYHHGKSELKKAEQKKLLYTKQFIEERNEPMEVVYKKIFLEIKKLRECYDEEATKEYDDSDLAWMLFVDGCFVLYYLDQCNKNVSSKKSTDSNSKFHFMPFTREDLFLLENQLPFRVLELLMCERFEDNYNGRKVIEDFIYIYNSPPDRNVKKQWMAHYWKQMQHHQEEVKKDREKPCHLLDLLRRRLIGAKSSNEKNGYQGSHWHPFRNVTELTAAGIRLKPSETNYLKDVSFHYSCLNIYGHLKLPSIIVDDSTRPKFLNLIAYEMSQGVNNGFEVTTYICFLNSLIDYPSDVKLLREASILDSFVSSDEEVANLFNEIGTNLVPNTYMYEGVKTSIQNQYNEFKTWKSGTAAFIEKHFRTPWTIAAFIWAVSLLILNASSKIKPVISFFRARIG